MLKIMIGPKIHTGFILHIVIVIPSENTITGKTVPQIIKIGKQMYIPLKMGMII